MDALLIFSATGETKKVNDYFQNKLPNLLTIDITHHKTRNSFDFNQNFNLIILSVPVHSENIPIPIRGFLGILKCQYMIINLTYGSITPGNALKKINKLLSPSTVIIGASLIPCKHSYLNHEVEYDFNKLDFLIHKVITKDYHEIMIPRLKGHVLSPILEKQRTRFNIKIKHHLEKCINCKRCIKDCPVNAIQNSYKISKDCLRCLSCVYICPKGAYTYKKSKLLTFYINRNIKNQSIRIFK